MPKEYPDDAEYNKLVRDGIVEKIEGLGLIVESRILEKDDLIKALKDKIVEEGEELKGIDSSDREATIAEISDVLEVLRSLAEEQGIPMSRVEEVMEERAQKRGRFKKGIFLESTRKAE